MYPSLFAPGRIGGLDLENRIVKASQQTRMANADGTVSERLVAHYRSLARGGAGLVMVEFSYVDELASKAAQSQVGVSSDEHLPGLAWLADTIRVNGARAGFQLSHCGRQKFWPLPPVKAASAVPWQALYEKTGLVPEPLTTGEIEGIVEAFGAAAARAVTAGFDVVEIHGGHGYLFTNFLSPHTNKRDDRYGGSAENRMRLLLEVTEVVRANVPAGMPVSVRISGTDYEPDGIEIEDTVALCRELEARGVDVVHVSGGHHARWMYEVSPSLIPAGPHVWAAEAVKAAVSIPVIASGSITTPELAEEILAAGTADFVSFGRPLWADPEWPAKARAGRRAEIRPCIRCNDGCQERTAPRAQAPLCSVNPRLGRETEPEPSPPHRRLRVAVVGGGPAGLEAAHRLTERGHRVTLFEKRRLGGVLHEASAPPFKDDLRRYLAYLVDRAPYGGFEILEEEAGVDALAGFDAAVLAVGAVRRPFPAPHALDLDPGAVAGRTVAVVGGGRTGTQTALAAAEAGAAAVTLLEAEAELMRGDVDADRVTYAARLAERGVAVRLSTALDAPPEADVVVAAVGYLPNRALAEALRVAGLEHVHEVGDGLRPGRLHEAVHGAFALAGRL